MADPFMSQIQLFPYVFAPRGWAWCNGQLLSIVQNTALFSLIGTFYGGDGRVTFGLPSMSTSPVGRVPLGQGQGPGLSDYEIGEQAGVPDVTLITQEMASHSHSFNVSLGLATSSQPPTLLFANGSGVGMYTSTTNPPAMFSPGAVGVTGNSFPHNNVQPFVTVNYCMALQGIYPPRDAVEAGAEAPEGGEDTG